MAVPNRLCKRPSLARIALLATLVVLAGPRANAAGAPASWDELLAPYSHGAPLPGGFRIDGVCYGTENDVVIAVQRDDGATAEVHVLLRGRWQGIRETRSFGVGYESGRSPAAERDAITEALAETIRARDLGLPPPDMIALGPMLERSACPARPSNFERLDVLERGPLVRGIQVAWALLVLAAPFLCWRAARAVGMPGARLVLVVAVSAALALGATCRRADEPLHANGHAWREAREVLAPWSGREHSGAPFLHGRGGIALQWLIAHAERALTGTADPFLISRLGSAAAAAGAAFLAAVLARSPSAGLAAGAMSAGMPLARTLAVSGSALAIPAAILPWSLALLIAGRRRDDALLLGGAALAAALGTLSHTAMLAWAPAWYVAEIVAARRKGRPTRARSLAVGAVGIVAAAWALQISDCFAMLAERNEPAGGGLLQDALSGFLHRNLMADPHWVSPLLLPLALVGVVAPLRREPRATVGVPLLLSLAACFPFFAVTACSSDAVRYQGAVLALVAALAATGLWAVPGVTRLGLGFRTLVRTALLAAVVLLPSASSRQPTDPVAVEHRLVVEGIRQMTPGTVVVLPAGRFDRIIPEFPDFLLAPGSRATFDGNLGSSEAPRLVYLGLACISWEPTETGADRSDLRPECRALRGNARPWLVRTLRAEDLPRLPDGRVWTFHELATEVPFGFFALPP